MEVKLTPYPFRVWGWGDHPTTRYLLAWLKRNVELGMRVADVGAGTGILGLQAAVMGADVTLYESNPEFRELIKRNAEANGVEVDIRGAFPDDWPGDRYDLLVINIGAHDMTLDEYAEAWADGQEAGE